MAPPSSLTLMQDEGGGGGEVVVSTPRKEEVLERATREEVQAESSLQPVLRASMKRWRSHQGAFNNEERIRTGGEEQHHQHRKECELSAPLTCHRMSGQAPAKWPLGRHSHRGDDSSTGLPGLGTDGSGSPGPG